MRVEDRQERDGEEDHRAVENQEAGFVLHKVAAPTRRHFGNTTIICELLNDPDNNAVGGLDIPVDTADDDSNICHHDGPNESLDLLVLIPMRVRTNGPVIACLAIPLDIDQHQGLALNTTGDT